MMDTSPASRKATRLGNAASKTLQDLLRHQVDDVSEEALRSNGDVTPERIAAVERLARLAEISVAVHPAVKKRWPIVAAMTITLLIVSLIWFVKVRETEIELDLALSEASFELPLAQVLTNTLQISVLGVVGLSEVELPRTSKHVERTMRATSDGKLALLVLAGSEEQGGGSITLEPLVLSANTRVELRLMALPNQFRLSLSGSEITIRASVRGLVRVGISGAPVEEINFPAPASMLLRSDRNQVDFDLTFPKTSLNAFVPQLAAHNLSLSTIEEHLDPARTIVKRVSTILSGTLYFESLNGQERKLRAGEAISLQGTEGEIRTLRLEDKQIVLSFYGRARNIVSGTGASSRSLMPTYLEWLQTRHGLSLLWGTSLYAFGLLIGALRWWGYTL
jgi:hypothetical protein